jgi:predicted flap endonuclease-1-like 5' DNA nuclease
MSILWFILTLLLCGVSVAGGGFGMRWYLERNREIAEREDPRDTEIRELQTSLKVARADATRSRTAAQADRDHLDLAHDRITELLEQLGGARQQYDTCKEVLKREIGRKNDLRAELEATRQELKTLAERAQEMDLELSVAHSINTIEDASGDPASVNHSAAEPLPGLESKVTADGSPSLIHSLSGEVEKWKRHCLVLGEQLKQTRLPPVAAANGGETPAPGRGEDGSDELKAMRGIGDVLERKLHQLGIYRYQELAELKTEDLKRISVLIPDFKARMRRYDWVDQARRLHQTKYRDSA